MSLSLPAPFAARRAAPTDVEAIAALFNACDEAYSPEPVKIGKREVAKWLELATASIVVTRANGEVVAAGRTMPRGDVLAAESLVLPEAGGLGIGSFLLAWSEDEARGQRSGSLRHSVLGSDERAKRLLTTHGYGYVRSFYRMVIDLDESPPAPHWPDGITVTPLRESEERVLHEVIEDAFAEHWGHVPRTFEEWRPREMIEHDLTFLARDGDEVAGTVVCHEDLWGVALVGILGVRKPWRGRGLGRALLLHGFGALYERGKRRIGLGVDAGNETGALELYRSAGMRIGAQDDVYEKRV